MNEIDKTQKEHHQKYYRDILAGGPDKYDGFINPESIWHWMHVHCLNHIEFFLKAIPSSNFLTVGDGYCGREAAYIKKRGHKVCATDWETSLIDLALSKGLVDECREEDLNHLSFSDNFFDYSLVKETLHHMSKPYIGLYELFRVSSRGVILIEPNGDNEQKYRYNDFEPTGNYMFGFSSHELIKLGIAYGFKFFVVSYSTVFFGFHNEGNINASLVEEERKRLIALEKSWTLVHRPLLVIFFLHNRDDFNLFAGVDGFIQVKV